MLVHADISALFCGLAAKRVGIQFAADGNIEAPCFDSSLERLDGFMGDGRFHEDRFDFMLRDESGQRADVGSARFTGGADSLDAFNFKSVISGKISKGVMGGDKDTGIFRDGFYFFSNVLVQVVQFGKVSVQMIFIVRFILRIFF